MEIISITLSGLRHSEYIEYMREYLKVFDRNDPVALEVKPQFDALTDKVDDIETVYKQDRASELTETIAELDTQRDEALTSISYVIRGYMGHYDESKANDAKRLNTRLNVYGGASGIARETLQGQSASLDNLIYDFQNDAALQASVMSLGLGDWISQLKIVNDNLRLAYGDRAEEKAGLPADKIKDLRNECNGLYYDLREMARSRAYIVGYAAPYDVLITGLNAITEMFNQTLARRSGSGEDDTGGDDPELPV